MLFPNLNASSEHNHEDDFNGSDDDFLGFYDEEIILLLLILVLTIPFSSNKLLKLKYIHHYFFLKFLTKKSRFVLWTGASYGPGNTVFNTYSVSKASMVT